MNSLVTLYKTALGSVDVLEDTDGLLYYNYIDTENQSAKTPVTIVERPFVLPHKENLIRERLEKEVVAFHPLSESVIRGESEVLQKLRAFFSVRFKLVLSSLSSWMLEQAIDPKAARKFSPKQKAFFDILADATPNTVTALTKIIEAGFGTPQYSLVNIYLRRTGATFEGQKVTRAAVVTFPFMEAIEVKNKKTHWCGVPISKKDQVMLENLFLYLVPVADEPGEAYNSGSTDTQAPYFDCLIHSFAKLMENLNNIILLLGDKYPDGTRMFTDTSWVQEFEPLSQFRGQIPPLPFNDGQLLNKTPEPTAQQAQLANGPSQQPVAGTIATTAILNSALPSKSLPATDDQAHNNIPVSAPDAIRADDALDRILNPQKSQPVEPAAPVWGAAPAQSHVSTEGNSYEAMMARVYNRNGMEIPANGFGAAQGGGWGVGQVPEIRSALRRRQAAQRQEVANVWSGMGSGSW